MRILVCFKIVRDLDNVIDSDWDSERDPSFRIDYTRKILNDADQGVLEAALLISDREPGTEITAVTVTDDDGASFFTGLFAAGIGNVVRIAPEEDLTLRPAATAALLAQYAAETGPYDLILFGAQAPPGDSRQVPYAAAEMLQFPAIDRVRELKSSDGRITAVRETDTSLEEYELLAPAAIIMENPVHSYLRLPTLRERMKASGKKAELIQLSAPALPDAEILGFRPARIRRDGRMISPEEAPDLLADILKEL